MSVISPGNGTPALSSEMIAKIAMYPYEAIRSAIAWFRKLNKQGLPRSYAPTTDTLDE